MLVTKSENTTTVKSHLFWLWTDMTEIPARVRENFLDQLFVIKTHFEVFE